MKVKCLTDSKDFILNKAEKILDIPREDYLYILRTGIEKGRIYDVYGIFFHEGKIYVYISIDDRPWPQKYPLDLFKIIDSQNDFIPLKKGFEFSEPAFYPPFWVKNKNLFWCLTEGYSNEIEVFKIYKKYCSGEITEEEWRKAEAEYVPSISPEGV